MKFSCIAVDLDKQGYKKQFEESNSDCSVELDFSTVKEFQKRLHEKPYAFLLIATSDYSNEVELILSQLLVVFQVINIFKRDIFLLKKTTL